MKKFLIYAGLAATFIAIIIYVKATSYLTHPSFSFKKQFNNNDTGITQTFHVDLMREGIYLVGLYTGQHYWLNKEPNDGNYTIEYYHDDKLIRTYQVGKWSEWLHRESDTPPREAWNSVEAIVIEEFSIPKDMPFKEFTVKITTHRPYSFLTRDGSIEEKDIYFFLMRRSESSLRRRQADEQSLKKILEDTKSVVFSEISERYDVNSSKLLLLNALLDKDFETVKSIIETENGIGVNTVLGMTKKYRWPSERTPVFYAAHTNDVKTLRYLIEKGADLDQTDTGRQNALAHAIENRSIDAAKILIDAGMRINDVDYVNRYLAKEEHERRNKRTPLVYAVSMGDYELTKFLLEHNATNRLPETVQGGRMDAYMYLYHIPNYNEMLKLLLDNNVTDFKGVLPSEKVRQEHYDSCMRKQYDWCGPISKDLKFEDFDYYIWFELKHHEKKVQDDTKS